MTKKEVSPAVIQRLPRYYRYLEDLMDQDVERTSSRMLSEIMNLTASQIRQDLNQFGGFGQQGYGYNVKKLHDEIGKILNIDKENCLIIIGAGNLGKALANYDGFRKRGFRICAIFDKDPGLTGKTIGGLEVLSMDRLEDFIKENNIRIAALCIPKEFARDLADELIRMGISGIWNFAHLDLDVPDGIQVESVHLSESLMRLSYKVGELYHNGDES